MIEIVERLTPQLIVEEGVSLKPYLDTKGKLTIGVGRNLTDKGISLEEAMYLLPHDIDEAIRDLFRKFPWASELSLVRQVVLVNMCFNMGIGNAKRGLASMDKTLKLIEDGNYAAGARGMSRTKWAKDVREIRAGRLCRMMETNEWPEDIK